MEPSKRTFPSRQSSTTEAALMTRGVSQLYLSLGDPNADGSIAVRLYHKPLVLLIWLGAVVMVARRRAVAVRPAAARRRAEAGAGAAPRCSRRSRAMRVARSCGSSFCWRRARRRVAGVRGAARRDADRSGARGARARRCRASCAAWSARTSRSTIPTRRWRAICALLVRERLKAGDSDAQVLDFLVARYGEFVLLKPRFGWRHGAAVARAGRRAADRRLRLVAVAPAPARSRRAPMPEQPALTRGRARPACRTSRRRPELHRPSRL